MRGALNISILLVDGPAVMSGLLENAKSKNISSIYGNKTKIQNVDPPAAVDAVGVIESSHFSH
jgi:hypothetical protein